MTAAQRKEFIDTHERRTAWKEFSGFCWQLSGDAVLMPYKDGEPDWENATRDNLERVNHWSDFTNEDIPRLAVLTDSFTRFIGDGNDVSVLTHWCGGTPTIQQIDGEPCDRAVDLIMEAIADDLPLDDAAGLPITEPQGNHAESLLRLAQEINPPPAANDNSPQLDKRLLPYCAAYGGEVRGTTLFGAIVDGKPGQISFSGADAWFYSATTAKRISLPEKPKDRFTVDWFGDLDEDMPKETIVKGVFGVNEFTMLSGKPGSGKSVITTDLACHVAAGMEWHGRRVKQGLVVYVAAERRDLTKRRMRAFRKRHGIGRIPLAVIGGRMDLTSTVADAEALAASIRQLEEDCGHKCVWIVIDTLTRVFGPGDQNASKDMSRFVLSCDALREAVPGSHVTVIHHTGWNGDRGKGAIDLDGAVDASFLVKKEGRGYLLECDGTNDGEEGAITRFTMEGVQVGVDEDGEPTIAPVVIPGAIEKPAERLLNGPARKALDALIELSGDGEPVPMALWRAKCRELFDDGKSTQDALNKKFDRAKEALVKDGKIDLVDGGFLPI
jgi:hypothetical protein